MSMKTCVWVHVTQVKCGQDGMCTSVSGGDRKISETPWSASLAVMTSFEFIEGFPLLKKRWGAIVGDIWYRLTCGH